MFWPAIIFIRNTFIYVYIYYEKTPHLEAVRKFFTNFNGILFKIKIYQNIYIPNVRKTDWKEKKIQDFERVY